MKVRFAERGWTNTVRVYEVEVPTDAEGAVAADAYEFIVSLDREYGDPVDEWQEAFHGDGFTSVEIVPSADAV